MIYWLGLYTLVMFGLSLLVAILSDKETLIHNTGGYRLARIILNLPSIYFVWLAWQAYLAGWWGNR